MLHIRNVRWVNPENGRIAPADLLIAAGPWGSLRVLEPGEEGDPLARNPECRIIDGKGMLATRSLGCGHHHIYSALSRGIPGPESAPVSFTDMLDKMWWRLDKKLDTHMIAASALYTGLQCLKNGITLVIDHHSSPGCVSESLEVIARAFDSLGLAHMLCYESSCRDGQNAAEQGLEENARYLATGRKGHVGLHASFTVDDRLLHQSVELAQRYQTGIHIHVAESVEDQEHCQSTYGTSVVKRLHRAGVLDLPGTILSHCVHIDQQERKLIENSPCWVVQNTESNLNNNVGLGHYEDFSRVMLGCDGLHSDMLRSARMARLVGGMAHDTSDPTQIRRRLNAVHTYATENLLPGNGLNNIVLYDYDSPTPVHKNNFTGHLFFGLQSRHVHTVIGQGRVLLENGRLSLMPEEDICCYARQQAARLWKQLA